MWAKAEELRLWDHPEWWTLGHYHRTMWGPIVSRIDDERFFLDPKGKHNRKLELAATLRAFLTLESGDPPPTRSLACRFPARRRWLLEKLEIPPETFVNGDCEDYQRAREQLAINQATLIYPSAYLNSPASMFGHLLLVLDREGKDRLLSRAVNYAAVVTDTFGPLFAIKGIFGWYNGVYAVMPYYDKVEEYNAVNRRDIWEYPLRIDGEGLDRLLRHVWELQGLKSRYFFFKENCAFNLLYPLEVASPELRMTRRFRINAIPVSLLQQLTRTGITGEPVYRPSKTTIMNHLASLLGEAEQLHALSIARGGVPNGNEDAMTLALAIELTQYFYTEQKITPDQYRDRVFPLLRARSRLGKVDFPPPAIPPAPESGHPPVRVQLYAGTSSESDAFSGFKIRPAYHDALDDPTGYPPGSFITFFEADTRVSDSGRVWIREINLIDIRSLTPASLWVTPLSWAVNFRAEADPFDPDHHRGFVQFGSGRTWASGKNTLLFAMLDSSLRVDSDLDNGIGWEPGGRWGLITGGEQVRASLEGGHHFGVLGSERVRHRAQAELRLRLRKNLDLGFVLRHEREGKNELTEGYISLGHLF